MTETYSLQEYSKETMARACGRSMPISYKHGVEICSMLRKRKVSDAKNILQRVIKMEQAVPFKKFGHNVGHRPGKMAAGRYPIKACEEILFLLTSAESNAQFKGLNSANLIIHFMIANKAGKVRRMGRQRGLSSKRTHVEIVLQELKGKSAEKGARKTKEAVSGKQTTHAQETHKEPAHQSSAKKPVHEESKKTHHETAAHPKKDDHGHPEAKKHEAHDTTHAEHKKEATHQAHSEKKSKQESKPKEHKQ